MKAQSPPPTARFWFTSRFPCVLKWYNLKSIYSTSEAQFPTSNLASVPEVRRPFWELSGCSRLCKSATFYQYFWYILNIHTLHILLVTGLSSILCKLYQNHISEIHLVICINFSHRMAMVLKKKIQKRKFIDSPYQCVESVVGLFIVQWNKTS